MADLSEARRQFSAGDYAGCISTSRRALTDGDERDGWTILLTRALLTTGQYPEALTTITNALAQDRWNIRLCWEAREAFLANGQPRQAAEMVDRISRAVRSQPSAYGDPENLLVYGQAALLQGSDPKKVLDLVFEIVRKVDAGLKEVYLASGRLGLEKQDFSLAAKKFEEGLKRVPDDPDLLCGLAQAYAPSDGSLMVASLEAALTQNSNHIPSLLLLADHCIDAEDYTEAARVLGRIMTINPWQSQAWAYQAVIAHLQNQPEAEEKAHQNALKFWSANPAVEYLIGRKLSENYRFTEGASHQRKALEYDPDYLPSKAQLAQDLLRLGEEAEGWKLAEEVQKQDAYNVEAYNLANLHDSMQKYSTLINRAFRVRMNRTEASVYGEQVLDLLARARSNLCAKYEIEIRRPTIVEIFSEQKDFAVRTFGMPGNPGYLGVCFGSVVTANSPAAHVGHAVNWQAVLWHEFCHVVTLQKTRNKMPRWLSEGISVYEEGRANPAWGQHMTPRYREMILGTDLTPVSKLSGGFLAPKSDLHLQFAYYESSLAVEFIVERFGLDRLKSILNQLGEGSEINQALATNTLPMQTLDTEFADWARRRAQGFVPGLDFEKPKLAAVPLQAPGLPGQRPSDDEKATNNVAPMEQHPPEALALGGPLLTKWISAHPTNYYALTEKARQLVSEKKLEEAKVPLQKLIELYPEETGSDCASAVLGAVYRGLGETNQEREVLARLASKDDEALETYRRLMELSTAIQDWQAVVENAQRFIAVNPLTQVPYRFLARASDHTGDAGAAIAAYRPLLKLDPLDPAEIHFRLAKWLHQIGDPGARREVLQALEEAPRYREALELLLEINNERPAGKESTDTTRTTGGQS